jgi:hypothetical protein
VGKSKQQTTQTNQYSYMAPPPNPYFKTAEKFIEGYDGGAGAVREGYARNVNDINESGNQFLGANTPDYVRDRIKQSRLFRNNLDLARGLSDANQNATAYKNSAYMSLGGATAPQLVQTGGTSNSTFRDNPVNQAIQIGGLAAA